MTYLFALLGFGALILLWLDSARAREFANTLAQRYCEHRGLQFLDQTVSLVRVGLRWTSAGLRIRRMFRFEFSLEGVGRRSGYVLMLGTRLETIDDGLPREEETPEDEQQAAVRDDPKVVPFRRRDR
jgi:hypothetical protein